MTTEMRVLVGILVFAVIVGTILFFVGCWLIEFLDRKNKALRTLNELNEKYELWESMTLTDKCNRIKAHIAELEELENKTWNMREVHIYFSKRVTLLVTLGLHQETI